MLLDSFLKNIAYKIFAPSSGFKFKYRAFKKILEADRDAHVYMAEIEEIYYSNKPVDCYYLERLYRGLSKSVYTMLEGLIELSPMRYYSLLDYFKKIDFYCRLILAPKYKSSSEPYVIAGISDIKSLNERLTGGKGYHLLLMKEELGLPVPDFFIITTNSFFLFLEENSLERPIAELLAQTDIDDLEYLSGIASKIKKMILASKIPAKVQRDVEHALKTHFPKEQRQFLSVRSSAVGEDGDISFAGQYASFLNVHPDDVLNTYKQIIASKYKANCLSYRIKAGYCDLETPVGVTVQQMIEPVYSGVAYSVDPESKGTHITIHVSKGIGENVVSGKVLPTIYFLHREKDDVSIKDIASAKDQNIAPDFIKHAEALGKMVITIERHLGTSIDCEWCIDKEGKLWLLQARPLLVKYVKDKRLTLKPPTGQRPILTGGSSASSGIASGIVHHVATNHDLIKTPKGAILVSKTMPPEYVTVFNRINGIISEKGSKASHCASVARELGIPYICGMKGAVSTLKPGTMITIDAYNCVIYKGNLIRTNKKSCKNSPRSENPRQLMLKQLLKLACQLELINPESEDFKPSNCRSLHDIIRFVHETAMRQMFLSTSQGHLGKSGSKRLVSNLPIIFYVLDVGRGLKNDVRQKKEVTPADFTSFPMIHFWKGLSHKKIKWDKGEHFAWQDYDSIIMAGGIAKKDSAHLASFALLASDYMNLNIRFGYHFVQIDAHCTDEPETNYILFRFSGGGATIEGKVKRAQFLVEVLKKLGFDAKNTAELVDAKFKHFSRVEAEFILFHLGLLVGDTKQMDMRLDETSDPKQMADDFLKGFEKTA